MAAEKQGGRAPESSARSLRPLVLVVEDHEDLQLILSDLLTFHQIEMVAAMTGEEAIDVAIRRRPCVVLLDLFLLGETSGFDVARRLRADPRTVAARIIAMSASGDEAGVAQEAISAGCDELHVKPLRSEQVLEIVRRAFDECGVEQPQPAP